MAITGFVLRSAPGKSLAPRDDEDWNAYTAAGGSAELDACAVELYRIQWTLAELSRYTAQFRGPQVEDANTRIAWGGFTSELTIH